MTLPFRPVIRPSSLDGQSNGRIAGGRLIAVPGQSGGVPITLVTPADRAWRALQAAALAAGHVLKTSWPTNSYRPYADQERIFLERYRTTYKANTDVKWWNGRRWYRWYGATAAAPGTSNHGWGLAIDLGEERDGDAGSEPVDQGTVNWLVANEERYGFSHEVQSEPWHIRYFAGDLLPKAVLDYEASLKPTPQPEDDDDMPKPLLLRLTNKDVAVLYMSSARTVHWVRSPGALAGYKLDMQMNGLSPDVCVLSDIADAVGTLDELHHFVVNLPFIGDWPTLNGKSTGVKEAWRGPHLPSVP